MTIVKSIMTAGVMALVLMAGVPSALAANWTYEGDPDIAKGSVGHESDHIRFQASGTYTLSEDKALGAVSVGKSGTTQTFDFSSGSHKLTLTGNLTIADGKTSVSFVDGVWDLSRYMFVFNKDGSLGGAGNDILLDGCVMTNAAVGQSSPIFFKAAENSRFRIVNGAKCSWDVTHKQDSDQTRHRNLVLFDNRDSGGRIATNAYFELSGGSSLTVRDFYLQNTFEDLGSADRDLFRNNRAVVAGAGTQLNVQKLHVGDGTTGNSLVISNGATVTTTTLDGSNTEALRPTPVTVDNATVKVDGHFEVGAGTYGGLDLTFTNNAVLQVGVSYPGKLNFAVKSSNNKLTLADATMKCARFSLGENGMTNNAFVIRGSAAKLKLRYDVAASTPMALFGTGSANRFTVSDGAQVNFWDEDMPKALVAKLADTWNGGAGNVLEVTGTSSCLAFNNQLWATNDIGSVIRAADGGKLTCTKTFALGGTNSALRVENGTVEFTSNTSGGGGNYADVMIGGDLECYGRCLERGMASNATVVLSGDCPRLKIPDTAIRFGNNSVLRFELPPNGYQTGVVPMDISYLAEGNSDDASVRGLCIELVGLASLQSNLTARTDITLVRCSRGYQDRGAVAEANAALPQGCSLTWQNGATGTEKLLVLRAKPINRGMVLIFR